MGTFVDQSLANKLNLPILHRENLTFTVFGENELKPKIYNAYSFKLVKKDGTQMQINAYGIDKLTSITVAFPNPDEKDLQSEVMEYDYLS